MKKLSKFIALLIFVFTAHGLMAQVKSPAASPFATLDAKVGLTDVSVEYSRPGVKDRKIFGGLVPFDKIWRAGANKATAITFSNDVSFGGKNLKAGTYALFIIPSANEWTLIFNEDVEQWGSGNYDEGKDALRLSVKTQKLSDPVESLTYDVNDLRNDGASLVITWDRTRVSAAFTVPTDKEVLASIESTMNGPSANDFSAAAAYYAENGKNKEQALKWFDKAIEMEPNRFWVVHGKAKLLASMGKNADAVKTAKQSLKLASEAENSHYVGLNEKLIESLK